MRCDIHDLGSGMRWRPGPLGSRLRWSEVIAAIQAVPGVVAVDLDRFARTDQSLPSIQPRLIADRPAMGADWGGAGSGTVVVRPESLTQLKAIQ